MTMATTSLVLTSEIVSSDVFGLFFDTLLWGIGIGTLAGIVYVVTKPLWGKGRL